MPIVKFINTSATAQWVEFALRIQTDSVELLTLMKTSLLTFDVF